MKVKREHIMLGLIFSASLLLRLYLAFSSNYTYDAYFEIRQVENIRNGLLPLFNDPLYYTSHPFLPFFHYVLAFIGIFAPAAFVFKVIPNLLAATSVLLAYLVSLELTRSRPAALFSALSMGFIPIFISDTASSVSPYTLVVPLMLVLIYLFMKLEEGNSVYFYLAFFFALVFTHQSAILLIAGLCLYVVILYVLGMKPSRPELEVIFFSLIASTWLVFLFFKEELLKSGLSVLWQNSPVTVLYAAEGLNILDAIYRIGILTFIAGVFITHKYVFEEKRKDVHLLISLSLAVLMLLAMKLVRLETGLMLLGVFFAVMSGEAYKAFMDYLQKTHIARNMHIILSLTIICFILTSALPSILYKGSSPSSLELEAFDWLSDSEPNSIIFADLDEGNLVPAVSGRKNMIDTRFPMSADVRQRLEDLEAVYTTRSQISALEILERYDVSYLVITKKALSSRNLTDIGFFSDDCYALVFENSEARVFRSLCRVSS